MILLHNQVSWVGMLVANLDYLAQIGPPAIILVFARNESDGTRFLKFRCKRITPNGEVVGHPWLIFLDWKHGIFCYWCKLLSSGYALGQHSIFLPSAGVTLAPPFWSGKQNSRQKVVNKGALLLCGGALRSCRGGLTFKFDKNSTNL